MYTKRKIFGFLDSISYKHNECRVLLCQNPRKKPVEFHSYFLPARWVYKAGIQTQNQPFVILEYFKGNKFISEIKPLCHKDDFKVVNLFDKDPVMKKKLDDLIEFFKKEEENEKEKV